MSFYLFEFEIYNVLELSHNSSNYLGYCTINKFLIKRVLILWHISCNEKKTNSKRLSLIAIQGCIYRFEKFVKLKDLLQ